MSPIVVSSTFPPGRIAFTTRSDTVDQTSSEREIPSSVRKYAFRFLVTPVMCAWRSITYPESLSDPIARGTFDLAMETALAMPI